MRLLYHLIVGSIPSSTCRLIIDSLKQRVAINLALSKEKNKNQHILTDVVYKFITTSRPVEGWLHNIEKIASNVERAKVPAQLHMIIGGNGAGKSHIKECLSARFRRFPYLISLELKVAALLSTELKRSSVVDDISSLILLQTDRYMHHLYNILIRNFRSTNEIREKLEEDSLDSEFIDIFFEYGEFRHDHNGIYEPLVELLLRKGSQIYLSIMKLYKKYLGIQGIFIFIDEFEGLHILKPERQDRFIESIRSLYDELASALADIHEKTRYRALETRSLPFEITPLLEDEIITIAEKMYTLYRQSGYLKYDVMIDFLNIPAYLIRVASFEKEPLTPRYVITQIIKIIENPIEFRSSLQQQMNNQQ
jgi:hypothetical protein